LNPPSLPPYATEGAVTGQSFCIADDLVVKTTVSKSDPTSSKDRLLVVKSEFDKRQKKTVVFKLTVLS
jgi:hypothetical protein